MNEAERFKREVLRNIADLRDDAVLQDIMRALLAQLSKHRYAYNFRWLGRPIIQIPQDMVAVQEIIWSTRPEVVVETGVAHGGSLVLSASILEILGGAGRVVGVDVDIREHNRVEIEQHPLGRRITLIEGSSIDPAVVERVHAEVRGAERVLVLLDSNHTHAHVAKELEYYSGLIRRGGYIVVFDTVIDDMPAGAFPDRPWGPGDNPKTAVREFLATNDRFEVDREIQDKLLLTVAPEGYLRCVRD